MYTLLHGIFGLPKDEFLTYIVSWTKIGHSLCVTFEELTNTFGLYFLTNTNIYNTYDL